LPPDSLHVRPAGRQEPRRRRDLDGRRPVPAIFDERDPRFQRPPHPHEQLGADLKRMFDKYSGLDPAWRNEARMVTTFANGSRVIMAGTDDSRYIKNILGGRVENGVFIVDESQDQPVLNELLDSILPPMMGANARLILSGVFPEAPVGRFWRESGWVERDGQWVQEQSRGWSRHNWGRLANVHLSDSWQVLQRYLADTGLTINDQQIIRDWQGKPAFDPNVTAYRYDRARNGYSPQVPDWLRMVYAQQKDDRGRDLKFAHEM